MGIPVPAVEGVDLSISLLTFFDLQAILCRDLHTEFLEFGRSGNELDRQKVFRAYEVGLPNQGGSGIG